MSNEEKISFKKIENYGFRISLMQAVTLALALLSGFQYYLSNDEKQVIDGASLHSQIKDLASEVRNSRARDSIYARHLRISDSVATIQRRQSDSVNLAVKFNNLKYFINADVHRLGIIERKLHINFVQETKPSGPAGPVALRGVSN